MLSDQLASSHLDSSQRIFCTMPERAIRLLAPAGSGKTYSLLWRALNLLLTSTEKSQRFLIVTFTRAARDELRDRIKTDPTFSSLGPNVDVMTLNSWGFRRIKNRKLHLELITTARQQFSCVKNTLQPVWQKHPRLKALFSTNRTAVKAMPKVMNLIDNLKSLGFRHDIHNDLPAFCDHLDWLNGNGLGEHVKGLVKTLDDMDVIDRQDIRVPIPEQIFQNFVVFWVEAVAAMYDSSLITLEDQKYWSFMELEQKLAEESFTTGIHRIQNIFVDEFQDINVLDLNLLKNIAAINKTVLTVVGDDDQAIFEWRGATPEFILEPDRHLAPGYQTCVLQTNYRSPRNIVEHSQRLIRLNQRRVPKDVKAFSSVDAEINVLSMKNLSASMDFVVDAVRSMLESNDVDKVAIISRKRSQIIPYQIVFASQEIPFYAAEDLQVFLSEAFNQLKEIIAIKARASINNPFMGIDVVRDFLQLCDKIPRFQLSNADRASIKQYLSKQLPKTLPQAIELFYHYRGALKGENTHGQKSAEFVEAMRALLKAETVSDTIEAISFHFNGLQKDYGKALEDIFYTDPPFLYLTEFAQKYGDDFSAFYTDIERAINTLAQVPPEEEVETNAEPDWKLPLHLMTALRAKGKEFDAVIILDANDDIWPSKLSKLNQQLEQERRLFYVAFTRARKKIFILVNESILGELVFPSPYIEELGLSIG